MNETLTVPVYDRSNTTAYGGHNTDLCEVVLTEDSITVDGKTMPIVYQQGFVYRLQKRAVRTSNVKSLLDNLKDDFWKSWNTDVCHHVKQYGK